MLSFNTDDKNNAPSVFFNTKTGAPLTAKAIMTKLTRGEITFGKILFVQPQYETGLPIPKVPNIFLNTSLDIIKELVRKVVEDRKSVEGTDGQLFWRISKREAGKSREYLADNMTAFLASLNEGETTAESVDLFSSYTTNKNSTAQKPKVQLFAPNANGFTEVGFSLAETDLASDMYKALAAMVKDGHKVIYQAKTTRAFNEWLEATSK